MFWSADRAIASPMWFCRQQRYGDLPLHIAIRNDGSETEVQRYAGSNARRLVSGANRGTAEMMWKGSYLHQQFSQLYQQAHKAIKCMFLKGQKLHLTQNEDSNICFS